MRKHKAHAVLALSQIALAVSHTAFAQDSKDAKESADATQLEAVVVTARRVAEPLQDVPVAVSAVTASKIEATGARGMEDIARLTPGFSFERVTGQLAQAVVRGQAQNRIANPVQNVATFFNGVYLQRPYQVDSELLGLDRVEVIKGPQSALFGRNAFAGAISYVSRRPSLEDFGARAEGTVGDYGRKELKGMVSVPLGGAAAFSVAASMAEFDGTWANNNVGSAAVSGPGVRTRGNVNGYDNTGALVQLRIAPTDRLEFNLFWNRRNILVESPANYQMGAIGLVSAFNTMNCRPFETAAQAARGTNSLICGELPASPVLAPGEPRSPGVVADVRSLSQDSKTNVSGATLEYALTDRTSLSYTFGYTLADALGIGSLSRDPQRGVGLPGPFSGLVLFDSRGNGDLESKSHEARLTYDTKALRLMGGVFFSKVDDFDYGVSYAALPNQGAAFNSALFPAGNVFPPGFSATRRNEEVQALFASVGAEVLPKLRLSLEARYTEETLRQTAATFPARAPIGTELDRKFTYTTPRLTADYSFNDRVMAYFSAAQGVKSGGFNPAATLPAERVFEPEKNWTYELGAKTELAGGRMVLNGALFHVNWTDLQVNRGQTGGTLGTPLIVGNLSGAKVNGAELQMSWVPSRALVLDAGLSYSDAEYNSDAVDPTIPRALCQNPATLPPGSPACPYNGNIGGNKVPRAPALQGNLGVGYRMGLGSLFGQSLRLSTRLDASYQSKLYVDNTNTAWAPERTLLNASLGIEGSNWSLRGFVRNLTDEQYVTYAFVTFAGSGAGSGVTYSPLLGDRRTTGVTLSVRY